MRNFDKQTTESVISACLIELGVVARNYLSTKEKCKKLFTETDWDHDLIAIFKAHDGNIFCTHFTDPGWKFQGTVIQCDVGSDFTTPPEEFQDMMTETLSAAPLNGIYIIEKYGKYFYAMPHNIEELHFDQRYQCLFSMN